MFTDCFFNFVIVFASHCTAHDFRRIREVLKTQGTWLTVGRKLKFGSARTQMEIKLIVFRLFPAAIYSFVVPRFLLYILYNTWNSLSVHFNKSSYLHGYQLRLLHRQLLHKPTMPAPSFFMPITFSSYNNNKF